MVFKAIQDCVTHLQAREDLLFVQHLEYLLRSAQQSRSIQCINVAASLFAVMATMIA
jgi:hypothetical protein